MTAHDPAHPMNGSRLDSQARRIFLTGENGGPHAGMPYHTHAHADIPAPDASRTMLSDVRLLCCVGPASGDAADTAADTAEPSVIVIARNVASVAF